MTETAIPINELDVADLSEKTPPKIGIISQEERDRQFLTHINGNWEKTHTQFPTTDPVDFVNARLGIKDFQVWPIENFFEPQIRQQLDSNLQPYISRLATQPDNVQRLIQKSLTINRSNTKTFADLVALNQRRTRIERLKDGHLSPDIDTSIENTINRVMGREIDRSLSDVNTSIDEIVERYREYKIVGENYKIDPQEVFLSVTMWDQVTSILNTRGQEWMFGENDFSRLQKMIEKRDELSKHGFLGSGVDDFNKTLGRVFGKHILSKMFSLTEGLDDDSIANLDSNSVDSVSDKLYKFLDYAREHSVLEADNYVESEKKLAFQLQSKFKKNGKFPWTKKAPTESQIVDQIRTHHFSTFKSGSEVNNLLDFYRESGIDVEELQHVREMADARKTAIQALKRD